MSKFTWSSGSRKSNLLDIVCKEYVVTDLRAMSVLIYLLTGVGSVIENRITPHRSFVVVVLNQSM